MSEPVLHTLQQLLRENPGPWRLGDSDIEEWYGECVAILLEEGDDPLSFPVFGENKEARAALIVALCNHADDLVAVVEAADRVTRLSMWANAAPEDFEARDALAVAVAPFVASSGATQPKGVRP